MDLRWKQDGDGWTLEIPANATMAPPRISVRPERGFWQIYVGNVPLMPGNWTSDEAAKSSAWTHIKLKAKAYFGTRNVRLVGA